MALFQVLCKIKLVGSHSNSLHCLCLFFLHWVICGKPLNLLQTIWKNTYFSEVLTALICLWMFSTVLYLQSTQQRMVGGWETREKVRTRGVPNGDKKKLLNMMTGRDFGGLVQFLSSEAFKIRLEKSQSKIIRPHTRPCFEKECGQNNFLMSPSTWRFHALKVLVLSSQSLCQTKQIALVLPMLCISS